MSGKTINFLLSEAVLGFAVTAWTKKQAFRAGLRLSMLNQAILRA